MISSFQFVNFKVDKCTLEIKHTLDTILMNVDPTTQWAINLSIRQPTYFQTVKMYLGGIDADLQLKAVSPSPGTEVVPFVKINIGVVGVFTTEDRFEPEVEQNLVRSQIPAILFPYLRAAATSVAASGGFGTVIIPLMNIQKWANEKMKEVKIDLQP
jgi:preprotein translocase subunit SecB